MFGFNLERPPKRKPLKWEWKIPSYAGWQKCPVCKGEGRIAESGWDINVKAEECSTCNGKRIINKLTGKPPTD